MQNPINLIDPTGMEPEDGDPKINVALVILYPNENFAYEDRLRNEGGFEGWDFIFATDIQDGYNQINEKYNDGEIDNFLLWSHGNPSEIAIGSKIRVSENEFERSKLEMMDFHAFYKDNGKIAEENLSHLQFNDINSFKNLSNKIKPGGNYIIGGCDIGRGDLFPTHLINALGLNNFNVYFNEGRGGYNFQNIPFSIRSNKLLNNKFSVKHFFNGIRQEDYSDLIINNDTLNPIILKR
jgi:hypothetical protein